MEWRFSLYHILHRILSYFIGYLDGMEVQFISYFTQNFMIFQRVSRWDGGSVYMIFYPEFYDISEGI